MFRLAYSSDSRRLALTKHSWRLRVTLTLPPEDDPVAPGLEELLGAPDET